MEPPDEGDLQPETKKVKLSTTERFKASKGPGTKNDPGKGKQDSKGQQKGKGKGKYKEGKGKMKMEKQDASLFPSTMAQLNVSFSTQSDVTNEGIIPGNMMKYGQIARDVQSAKQASTKADKVRFPVFALAGMDMTALEIAVLIQYIRPDDTLVMAEGPGGHKFELDMVTRSVLVEAAKTVVVSSVSSHRLKYCGSAVFEERISQWPLMVSDLLVDTQLDPWVDPNFPDDPDTLNRRTPYPAWMLSYGASCVYPLEFAWMMFCLVNAISWDVALELTCRAVWGLNIWNEGEIIQDGGNRFTRRLLFLKEFYETVPNKSELEFLTDKLRKSMPADEAQMVSYVNDPSNMVAWILLLLDQTGEETLLQLFNNVWSSRTLPPEWAQAIIVSFYKGKGSSADPANYRPISLLNTLYKLFVSILQARIARSADHFIRKTQYGFRAHRSTGQPIFLVRRLMDWSVSTGTTVHLLFLDWKQAFDKVDHSAF